MAINVLLPDALRPLAAWNERVPLEAATAGEAITKLVERYPDLKRGLPSDLANPPHGTALYRNGADLRQLQGLDTQLRAGDRLTIVVPVGSM